MSAAAVCEMQRARGALRVAFKRRGAATVLDDLRQEGCLKARFPRTGGRPEAVLLNSSGGIAGGDRLMADLAVREGAAGVFTSQAAERIYRALPADPPSRIRTRLAAAAGACAEWLPQETILFDGAALDRGLEIDAAEDARVLAVEALVFGRALMGERVARARLADTIRVRRAGRLVLHEALRIDGAVADALARPAVAAGARALATIVLVSPDADALLAPLRDAWNGGPAECGASAWNGMLVGRVLAADGACLRAAIVAGLAALRGTAPLPRVWNA